MSYLALYRKYRPTNFDDLVGQNYVSSIIKKEILNNHISHAYLFSGPRGTGKTSTAKIIAKMINCLNLSDDGIPCGKCQNCLTFSVSSDIVEIDAASNNGVDEIRELRDKANLVPTSAKYKIYIIDEVHMLTNQAFNALLKILEEPPSHIIFILATTEFNKIPITVVSRCQKFKFTKVSNDEIVDRMKKITSMEDISIDDEALYEIARLSDGGLRDAINMLDQLSSYKVGKINVLDVYNLNGVVSYNQIYNFLLFIINDESSKIIEFIQELDRNGNSIVRFLEDFLSFLKDVMLFSKTSDDMVITGNKEDIIEASKILSLPIIYNIIMKVNDLINKVKVSSCPTILTLSFFINLSISSDFTTNSDNKKINDDNVTDIVSINDENEKGQDISLDVGDFLLDDNIRKIRINNSLATASKKYKDYIINNWNLINDKLIDKKYGSVAALLNDTEVLVVGESYMMILAKYDSLLRRLYNNLSLIEDLFRAAFNKKYEIVFLTKDEWQFEKEKYIVSIKKGNKYNIIENKDTFLMNNDKQIIKENNSSIDKVISILGEDVIEYK